MPPRSRRIRKPKKADLDRAFAKLIKERDGRCQGCGSTDYLQCAHIVSRRYAGVRWDEDNALALCRGCHLKYTVRPLEWETWVDERMGAEAHRALKLRALAIAKVDHREVAARLGL